MFERNEFKISCKIEMEVPERRGGNRFNFTRNLTKWSETVLVNEF